MLCERIVVSSDMVTCPDCAGTGVCPACEGKSAMLVAISVDTCPRCASFSQIENGEQRAWCPDCEGTGRQVRYERLVDCGDCAEDGCCAKCDGTGWVRSD